MVYEKLGFRLVLILNFLINLTVTYICLFSKIEMVYIEKKLLVYIA